METIIRNYIAGMEKLRNEAGNIAINPDDTLYGGKTFDEEILLANERLTRLLDTLVVPE